MDTTTEITMLSPAEHEELATALAILQDGRVSLAKYRRDMGRALQTIKRLWEKQGDSFKEKVSKELGIPYTTAQRYMELADQEISTNLVPDMDEDEVCRPFEVRHDDTPDTQEAELTRQREAEKAKVARARSASQNKGTVTVHVSGLDEHMKSKLSQVKKDHKESFDQAAQQFIHVLLMTSPAQVLDVLNQLAADNSAEEDGSHV